MRLRVARPTSNAIALLVFLGTRCLIIFTAEWGGEYWPLPRIAPWSFERGPAGGRIGWFYGALGVAVPRRDARIQR